MSKTSIKEKKALDGQIVVRVEKSKLEKLKHLKLSQWIRDQIDLLIKELEK